MGNNQAPHALSGVCHAFEPFNHQHLAGSAWLTTTQFHALFSSPDSCPHSLLGHSPWLLVNFTSPTVSTPLLHPRTRLAFSISVILSILTHHPHRRLSFFFRISSLTVLFCCVRCSTHVCVGACRSGVFFLFFPLLHL